MGTECKEGEVQPEYYSKLLGLRIGGGTWPTIIDQEKISSFP